MYFNSFGVGKRSMEDRVNEEMEFVSKVIESYNEQPFSAKVSYKY